MAMKIAAPPPPLPRSLSLELDRPPPQPQPPWNIIRNSKFGEEADNARDDDRDHQHPHVAVADMGQLVAEHRFDLLVVEMIEQSLVLR